MAEIEYIEIDPASRKILSPAGMILGVMEDADSERKYFKCPKIVGDDIDLSQLQIYFKYTQATDKDGTKFETKEPGIYHCDDVNDEGDYITFSWKLSGNVFLEKGFIAFSMFASDWDVVKWGTTTAVGTVLLTIPGGLEEAAERYPDIISQLLNRMDEVEAIATPEAMQNYVEAYLVEHPAELDETLTDNTKAAPAGMVGEMKEEISSLSEEIINQAEVDDDGLVFFKNSQGLTLFTLDLSEFSSGGNVYGELVISTESLSINEGESGTFTVKLATAPTTNQIVYLALSDNTKLSITSSTLTFTPSDYGTEQTVTVTALEDEDSDDETITISLTSKKVSAKSLLVSIADDDIGPVQDGLTLYYNLRNGDLTDSVGGVVATNGGTIVDGGVKLESNNTKFQFVYPVKTENIPNGATVELALTGLADFQGAGNGYGTGYAYRNIFYDSSITAGFAYTANGSIAISDFSFSVIESPNTFIDFATENHICFVYNADGSADIYFNGELFKTRNIPDGFEHYNASGNITFKIPYGGAGGYITYPVTLSEIRIYERALTSDEVKNNYDATVSHQETVNF